MNMLKGVGLVAMAMASTAPMAVAGQGVPIGNQNGGNSIRMTQPQNCLGADAAKGADVVVMTMRGGAGGSVPFAIGDSPQPASLVRVTGSKGKPTVLVLLSSSSTLWDLRGISSGRLKAIVVHGSMASGVVGAPEGIPIEFASSQSMMQSIEYGYGRDPNGCAPISAASEFRAVPTISLALIKKFGKRIDRLYGGTSPVGFDLDGADVKIPETVDVKASDVKSANPVKEGELAPGVMGMRQLVERDIARPFDPVIASTLKSGGATIAITQASIDAMKASFGGREMPQAYIDNYRNRTPQSGYILLKNTDVLPRGFSQGGASIVLAPGVKMPVGGTPDGRQAQPVYEITGVSAGTLTALPKIGRMEEMMNRQSSQATPVDMKVTWVDGEMRYRSAEEDKALGSYVATDRTAPATIPTVSGSEDSKATGMVLAGVLGLLALAGIAFAFIRRPWTSRARPANRAGAKAGAATGEAFSGDDAKDVMIQMNDLEGTAKDPALLEAIGDFRRKVSGLAVRADLEDDLIDECQAIVDKRFSAMAERYTLARPRAEAATGAEMDNALRASLQTMIARLAEIGEDQDRRNVKAMSPQ